MNGIGIRAAMAAEIDGVLALWRDAGAEPTTTDDAEGVRALLARDPGALLVAVRGEGGAPHARGRFRTAYGPRRPGVRWFPTPARPASGGELVGTLVVGWDGWRGSLYRLAVAPHARRGGIGRALVAAGEERLRGLGARRASLIVVEGEEAAEAFWDALGYERQTARARYVKNL